MWTITLVDVLELTTGFGPPTEGENLKAGSQKFTEIYDQLQSALPGEQWQGTASGAYADADKTLRDLAEEMAQLDLELAALVKGYGDVVTDTRLSLGILKDILVVALILEIAMIFMPPPAQVISKWFGITVSVLGSLTALGMIGSMMGKSSGYADEAGDVAAKYEKVTADAPLLGKSAAKTEVSKRQRPPFPTSATSRPPCSPRPSRTRPRSRPATALRRRQRRRAGERTRSRNNCRRCLV